MLLEPRVANDDDFWLYNMSAIFGIVKDRQHETRETILRELCTPFRPKKNLIDGRGSSTIASTIVTEEVANHCFVGIPLMFYTMLFVVYQAGHHGTVHLLFGFPRLLGEVETKSLLRKHL